MNSLEMSTIERTISADRFSQSAWDMDTAPQSLTHYLAHVNKEIQTFYNGERVQARNDRCLTVIRQLRKRPNVSRADLYQTLQGRNPAIPESALDLTVRIMFSIAALPTSVIGGQLFRPQWKSGESIATLISRTFPQRHPDDVVPEAQKVKMQKLSASYVTKYTQINIQWTDYLSDHLLLSTGISWKTLYVFRHPAFLHAALQSLEGRDSVSDTQAISQGCLPPSLMTETLATLHVLFPSADKNARTILEKEVNRHRLDASLLEPPPPDHFYHETQRDALLPRSVSAMYKRFPYWGERLYDLWIEAEDPTPITRVGNWSDSRKSGRYAYSATTVALIIASFFGIAATILAALQVWISYCSWIGDPSRTGCSRH